MTKYNEYQNQSNYIQKNQELLKIQKIIYNKKKKKRIRLSNILRRVRESCDTQIYGGKRNIKF